ncbi:MAG: hypothetical protein NW217_13155 [Hyphomicrobiaceae bacterium]|nr:hypothetical protein [Hyphomicrobiaceae bacterium]
MTVRTSNLKQTEPKRTSRRLPKVDSLDEAQIGRFDSRVRRELRRLVRLSPRFADLAQTFPAVVHVIAARQRPPAQHEAALELVLAGAQLKAVARALDVPWWLRRLPPELFEGPLPDLPAGETFARRIASRIPEAGAHGAFWLEAVAFGAHAAHDEFAIWLAQQRLHAEHGEAERLFALLAAYAWHSGAAETEAASLIAVPWRPELSFDTALCAAKSWFNRLRLVIQLESGILPDPWLEPGEVMGLSFVPLTEYSAILDEARAMQNCADQYADRLSRDRCRLFSVRRGTTRVATLEIGPHPREAGVLSITQLKARHNMPASLEVWQAAHAWLGQQQGLKRLPPMLAPERALNTARWRHLLAAYRSAKGGAKWLPETITHRALARLELDMSDLARRADVTSWLFT